jgi:hypothetical protein
MMLDDGRVNARPRLAHSEARLPFAGRAFVARLGRVRLSLMPADVFEGRLGVEQQEGVVSLDPLVDPD